MTKSKPNPTTYTEPESVRRKLADAFRERAKETRWTPAERGTFARMAESWERTLPDKKK